MTIIQMTLTYPTPKRKSDKSKTSYKQTAVAVDNNSDLVKSSDKNLEENEPTKINNS